MGGRALTLCWPTRPTDSCCTDLTNGQNGNISTYGIKDGAIRGDKVTDKTLSTYNFTGLSTSYGKEEGFGADSVYFSVFFIFFLFFFCRKTVFSSSPVGFREVFVLSLPDCLFLTTPFLIFLHLDYWVHSCEIIILTANRHLSCKLCEGVTSFASFCDINDEFFLFFCICSSHMSDRPCAHRSQRELKKDRPEGFTVPSPVRQKH